MDRTPFADPPLENVFDGGTHWVEDIWWRASGVGGRDAAFTWFAASFYMGSASVSEAWRKGRSKTYTPPRVRLLGTSMGMFSKAGCKTFLIVEAETQW